MSISSTSLPIDAPTATFASRIVDYVELTKPRIAILVLVTVVASGTMASWGQPQVWSLVHAMIGIALVAASASALNQWIERQLDTLMPRTAIRPIPAGRITPMQAVVFAAVTFVAGIAYLAVTTNWLTVLFAFGTWVTYAWIYTPMKTRTPINTAVGAISGALPVWMGWAACDGAWDARAASLFLIMFLWQFPHFMAIAWMCRDDYRRAGHKMVASVPGSEGLAGRSALTHALVLIPISILPTVRGEAGLVYLLGALLLGAAYLAASVAFAWKETERSARAVLLVSLFYLPLIFSLILFDPAVRAAILT